MNTATLYDYTAVQNLNRPFVQTAVYDVPCTPRLPVGCHGTQRMLGRPAAVSSLVGGKLCYVMLCYVMTCRGVCDVCDNSELRGVRLERLLFDGELACSSKSGTGISDG